MDRTHILGMLVGACALTMASKPPKIMRLPSKGIGLRSGDIRGSTMVFAMLALRVALSGQVIQEETPDCTLQCLARFIP